MLCDGSDSFVLVFGEVTGMHYDATIGLIGCGAWGKYLLGDLVKLGARVFVVARNEASVQNAQRGGAAAVVSDVHMLPAVDGLVIATPTSTHAQMIEAVAPRGVPMFVEKPLTPDVKMARDLASRYGDRLFVMDKWRYHPGIEELARIARSNELGPLLGIRSCRLSWGCGHTDVDHVWTLSPHDLSIALEIFGWLPEVVSGRIEIVNDIIVSLSAILGDSPYCVIDISSRSPVRRREIQLHCRDGSAILDDGYSDSIHIVRNDGSQESRTVSTEMPTLRELCAFLGYLKGGPPPRSSAAEAATIVERIAQVIELGRVAGERSSHAA